MNVLQQKSIRSTQLPGVSEFRCKPVVARLNTD